MSRITKLIAGVIAVSFTITGISTAAFAEETPPVFVSPIIDNGDMFTVEQETMLTDAIVANFNTYNLAFVIKTIPSLNGETIESAALTEANKLGVGNIDEDNGVFILLSRDDREIRFELGTSVSLIVSDAATTQTIDDLVIPQFKAGDYVAGITDGMQNIGSYYNGTIVEPPAPAVTTPIDWTPISIFFIFVGKLVGSIFALAAIVGTIVFWLKDKKKKLRLKLEKEDLNALNALREKRAFFVNNAYALADSKKFEDLPNATARGDFLLFNSEFKTQVAKDPDYDYFESVMKKISPMFSVPSNMSVTEAGAAWNVKREVAKKVEAARLAAQKEADEDTARQKVAAKQIWDNLSPNEQNEFKKSKGASGRKALLPSTTRNGDYTYDNGIMYPMLMLMYFSSINLNSSGSIASDTAHAAQVAADSARRTSASHRNDEARSSNYSSYDSSSSFGGGSFDGGGGSGSW